MSTVLSTDIFALADRLRALREEKAALKERLKAVNAEIEATEEELATRMLDEDVPNFERDGHKFYLSTRVFASARKDRAEELYAWLREHGYGDLVRETVHAQSLSALCRELMESGMLTADLADLVNVYERITVNIRRA